MLVSVESWSSHQHRDSANALLSTDHLYTLHSTITQYLLHFAITFGRLTHMHYSHGWRMCIIILRIISHHCRLISSRSSINYGLTVHQYPVIIRIARLSTITNTHTFIAHLRDTASTLDCYTSRQCTARTYISLPFSTTCITNQHCHLSSFIEPGVYRERHS